MFVRIVKLSFHQEHIPAFLENFEVMKEKIRNAPGTRVLELLLIAIGNPKLI